MQVARVFGARHREEFDALYTLWFTSDTIGFARAGLQPAVSRVHGYDLYEEVGENRGYIPFRRRTVALINKVIVLSDQARKYVKRYGFEPGQINLVPLGVPVRVPRNWEPRADIVGVSCSYPNPGKRLPKILDIFVAVAASQPERQVIWHHFGARSDEIALPKEIPPNLKIVAHGKVDNAEVCSFYADNDVDFFINFSVSEGQPVSIMEAMSFGIPIVATDVGGVRELVGEGGVIVPSSAEISVVKNSIEELLLPETRIFRSEMAVARQRGFYDAVVNAKLIKDFISNELLISK
jgi:glycosyltransferase involved in cell wall biosynthesis